MSDEQRIHQDPPSGVYLYAGGGFTARTEETAIEIDKMMADEGRWIVVRISRRLDENQPNYVTDLVRIRKNAVIAYG